MVAALAARLAICDALTALEIVEYVNTSLGKCSATVLRGCIKKLSVTKSWNSLVFPGNHPGIFLFMKHIFGLSLCLSALKSDVIGTPIKGNI